MNPYGGYQLYQVQRTKTRAEILADDARRGRQAAVFRGSRAPAGEASTPGIIALNAQTASQTQAIHDITPLAAPQAKRRWMRGALNLRYSALMGTSIGR